MRSVIKERRECSEPPLDSSSARVPASSFCPLRPSSEPSRRRASALPLRSHAVRFALFRRPAPLGATPGGYRSHASGCSLSLHRYALLWLRSEGVHASGTRRPHQPLWGSLYGSAISFTGDTPTCSDTKRGGGLPPPQGVKMSNSQSVRHSLKRRAFQRFGRIGHREIEEANTHRVAVLALHDCTTAPSTRNLGRRRVALRDSP